MIYFSCATFIKTIASLIKKLKTFLLLSTKTPQTSGVFVFLEIFLKNASGSLSSSLHLYYVPIICREKSIFNATIAI